MSLNIGNGLNGYNQIYGNTQKLNKPKGKISTNLKETNKETNTEKADKPSFVNKQYDISKIGTIREAILAEKTKTEEEGKCDIPAYTERLTWYDIDITNTPDIYKVLVPISEESKKFVYESVKIDFETTARRAYDDITNIEKYHDYCKATAGREEGLEKLKMHWSIGQYRDAVHTEVEKKVRELDPKWDWGQPVKTEVLNEIFGKKFDISI